MQWQSNNQRGDQESGNSLHQSDRTDERPIASPLNERHTALPPEIRTLPDTIELAEPVELSVGYSIHPASTPDNTFRQCLQISIPHTNVYEMLLELAKSLGDEVEVVIGTSHLHPAQDPDETIREGVEQFLLRSTLQPFEELVSNDACTTVAIFNELGSEIILTKTREILCFSDDLTIFRDAVLDRDLSISHGASDVSRLPHRITPREEHRLQLEEALYPGWGSPFGPQRILPSATLIKEFAQGDSKLLEGFRTEDASPPYGARYIAAISHHRLQDLYSELVNRFDGPVSVDIHAPREANRFTRYQSSLLEVDEITDHALEAWNFVSTDTHFAMTIAGSEHGGARLQIELGHLKSLTIDTDNAEDIEALLERFELESCDKLVTAEQATEKVVFDDTLAEEKYKAFAARYLRLTPAPPGAMQQLRNSGQKALHNIKESLYQGLHLLSRFGI